MYLSQLCIENFRCFGQGEGRFEMALRPGLTALVGENDAGKTAVIDAIRIALGTADQEWYRIKEDDFCASATDREIRIQLKFEGLSIEQQTAFLEYLTFEDDAAEGSLTPVLYVNWRAHETGRKLRGRKYRRIEVRSGSQNDGPILDQEVRELLRATYLRPLRDAEQALSPGRGSRLAQILQHVEAITSHGEPLHLGKDEDVGALNITRLNVLGIAQLANWLLERQQGVMQVKSDVDKTLSRFSLSGDGLQSSVHVSGAGAEAELQLRGLLEKLELTLEVKGRAGLGANNLLFMASELLLLANDEHGLKLLLIEEPEAHLHAQSQLRAMSFLQEQARDNGIQIIVTTHSPNLASAIDIESVVVIHDRAAYPLRRGETRLEAPDYRFLQRFLDVTKANLFFARAVMIVEGPSEAILIPALARILGKDFTAHGVSIINVGGVGLHRYSRIFQRNRGPNLKVPVACVVDLDIMPDCAPRALGRVKKDGDWPCRNGRRWLAKRDFKNEDEIKDIREGVKMRHSGQLVKTFVADEWTFEYALALGPTVDSGPNLAKDVFISSVLAHRDEAIQSKTKSCKTVLTEARREFKNLQSSARADNGWTKAEALATSVYAYIYKRRISKPILAQYLAERVQRKYEKGQLAPDELRAMLPNYLVKAIDYVTGKADSSE